MSKNNRKLKIFCIKKLDIGFISDTYIPVNKWLKPIATFLLPSLEGEVYGSVDFLIVKKSFYFSSIIKLSYPDNFHATARANIDLNGKLKIFKLLVKNDNTNISD